MYRLLFVITLALSALCQSAGLLLGAPLGNVHRPDFIPLPACRNQFSTVRVASTYSQDGVLFATRTVDEGWKLLRSTDAGQTWQVLSLNGRHRFSLPAFSPAFATDRTLFSIVWLLDRFFRSADAGDTWTEHLLPDTPGVSLLASASATELFAGSGGGPPGTERDQGVFYSADLGEHWQSRWVGTVVALTLSPNFAVDQTIFQGGGGLYKSTDAGLSWTPIINGLSGRWTGAGISQISFSPGFAQDRTVFALEGQDIHRTTDAGEHWLNLTNDVEMQGWSRVFIVSPRFPQDQTLWREGLYDDGLYISQDAGDTWQALPYDLQLQDAGTVCDSDGMCGVALFATRYDRAWGHSAYRSLDNGHTWQCLPPAPQHSLYFPLIELTGAD